MRSNLKYYFDVAVNGNSVIITRPKKKNAVLISEEEYNYVKGYIEKTVKIKYNELSLKDKVRYIFTI